MVLDLPFSFPGIYSIKNGLFLGGANDLLRVVLDLLRVVLDLLRVALDRDPLSAGQPPSLLHTARLA